ncbi:unnamed protein product [Closterium sp. NIES-64]|nr:unnamed protein product [Closterium sp. NIES-64]
MTGKRRRPPLQHRATGRPDAPTPPEAPGALAPILLRAAAALVAREEGTAPSRPQDPIYRSPRGRTHPYLRARGGSFRTRRPPRRSPAVQRQVVGPLLQQPALAAQSQPLRLPPSLSQSASSPPCSASEPTPAAVPLPPPYTHPPPEASPPVHAPPAAPSFPLPPSAPPPGGPPVPPPPPSPRSQTGHAVTSPRPLPATVCCSRLHFSSDGFPRPCRPAFPLCAQHQPVPGLSSGCWNDDELPGTPRDPDVDWWAAWPSCPREGGWGQAVPGEAAYRARGARLSQVGRCLSELAIVLEHLHVALQQREVVARDPQLGEDQQGRVREAVAGALWELLRLPLEPEDPLLDDGPGAAAFRRVATAAESSPLGISTGPCLTPHSTKPITLSPQQAPMTASVVACVFSALLEAFTHQLDNAFIPLLHFALCCL